MIAVESTGFHLVMINLIIPEMKKILIYSLSIALTAIGVASCAKSNKRKMANEWQVTSFEQTRTGIASNYEDIEKTVMNENNFTRELIHKQNDSIEVIHSNPGTVNNHVLDIKKDGTWTWVRDLSYDGVNTTIIEQSGTWSFVGKTKSGDFKKNERVLFNVLLKETTVIYQTGEEFSEETYLTGENVLIYTVTESKRKELSLEMDFTNKLNYNGNPETTDKLSQKITLKEK
ncbi:hypothetical protein D3C87_371110 [compost metagenome]